MIFLSKNNQYPFQVIDENLFYELSIDLKEEKDDIISKIKTLYLIVDYEKLDHVILKIENENDIGINMFISLLDNNGNPKEWSKEIHLYDIDSTKKENELIIIPLKIKWNVINNDIFYNSQYYISFINIYTDDKYLSPKILYNIKNKYFTETTKFIHSEQYILDIQTPNVIFSSLYSDNDIIKISKQSERRYIIDIGFFEEKDIEVNFVLKIQDIHDRYAKEEIVWNVIGYIPTNGNILIKDIKNNIHDYFIDNQKYFVQFERTSGNSDIIDTSLYLLEPNENIKIKKDSVFNYILEIWDLKKDLNLKLRFDILEENNLHVVLDKEIYIYNYQFPDVEIVFTDEKGNVVNELIDNKYYDIELKLTDSKIKIVKSEILEYSPKNMVYVGILEDFKYRVYIQKLIEDITFNIKFNVFDEYNNMIEISKEINIIHQPLAGV